MKVGARAFLWAAQEKQHRFGGDYLAIENLVKTFYNFYTFYNSINQWIINVLLILQTSTLFLQNGIPNLAAYIFLQNSPIFYNFILPILLKSNHFTNVELVETVEAPTA